MSRWYRSDKEQEGYDSYNKPGYSRYDGDYEYEQGWDEHVREERRERERREEQRELEREQERQNYFVSRLGFIEIEARIGRKEI